MCSALPPGLVTNVVSQPSAPAGRLDDPPSFDIELSTSGDRHVVRLRGELDLAYAGPVRAVLVEIVASEVVLDLRDLTFIDASGLSALLAARRQIADQGHRLVLMGAVRAVRRVFELTGLADLLEA